MLEQNSKLFKEIQKKNPETSNKKSQYLASNKYYQAFTERGTFDLEMGKKWTNMKTARNSMNDGVKKTN